MIRCLNCMKIFSEEFDVCPHCGQLVGAPPEIAYHIYPGTILNDRYVIGTTLGHGGFGITYNAWDKQLNVHIAIKEYYPNGLVNRIPGTSEVLLLSGEKEKQYYDGLSRFLDEARQTVKFGGHPNIVQVFDFFQENNTAYIVMEYLDGISLKGLLKQWEGHMPIDQSIEICTSICDALTEIHKYKILHRDINPSNIFLCVGNNTKLIDFGNARISDDEKEKTRSVIITPGYAPPEQYRAKSKQSGWSDLYSLCAVLYRCVAGQRPVESLDRMVEDTLENPMTLNNEVEEWLDKIIMRGMALNPEIRFRNAEELKKALTTQQNVQYPEERIKSRRIKRIVCFVSVLAGLIGAAALTGWYVVSNLTLPKMNISDESIVVWVEAEDKERFESATSKFYEIYGEKNIDVTVEEIESGEYAERLAEAIENDECPDVFLTKYLAEEDYDVLSDMKRLRKSIDKSEGFSLSILDEYNSFAHSDVTIPLGYEQLSLIVNKNSGLTEEEFTQYCIDESDIKAVSAMSYEVLSEEYSEKLTFSEDAVESFVQQDSEYYLGLSCDYKIIQNKAYTDREDSENGTVLGNYFSVPLIIDDEAVGVYDDIFGVYDSGDTGRVNASQLYMYFLLSENGQSRLHINNAGAVPVNKYAMSSFAENNSKIAFVEEYGSDIDFIN